MAYSTIAGVRELIPFITSTVMPDATVSGNIARADGDIDAWMRPAFQVPFVGTAALGTIDKIIQGISEAFAAAYCLDAYTGRHLANTTDKVGELRKWGSQRLDLIMNRPEMLDADQHPMRSAYDSQSKNQVMWSRPSNATTIDVNAPAEEWRYPSKSDTSV